VEIVIAPKRGQKLPKPNEMVARANEISSSLQDIAKEWRTRDVQKTITTMSFQRIPT
jgi:translation initiation factor IF-3